jgi:hypothetical protein
MHAIRTVFPALENRLPTPEPAQWLLARSLDPGIGHSSMLYIHLMSAQDRNVTPRAK